MSIRTFIFCDCCNPQGIRAINNRSNNTETPPLNIKRERRNNNGRRNIDGRSWYEGSISKSLELGWIKQEGNRILCPKCNKKSMPEFLEKTA